MNYKEKIGTKDKPLQLKTPPLSSAYTMHVDEKDGQEILVCTVGSTVLHYDIRCLNDLHEMLKAHGDWMELGSKDEKCRLKKVPLSIGGDQLTIPLAAGMDLKRISGDVSVCTFRL